MPSFFYVASTSQEDAGGDKYKFVTVRPDVNVEGADGSIATKTIVDENKNQTRQTIYQPADSQVIILSGSV